MQDTEYESLISKLTEEFKETIPTDEKYKEELIEAFKNNLQQEIQSSGYVVRASKFLTSRMLKAKARQFMEYSLTLKKKALLRDDNFDKLKGLSEEIFELAKQTLFKGDRVISGLEVTDKMIAEVRKLRDSVKDFNEEEAKHLVSETILDLDLICCPGTDVLSFRTGKVLLDLPEWRQKELVELGEKNQKKYSAEIKDLNRKEDEEKAKTALKEEEGVER